MNRLRLLVLSYVAVIVALFLYSYTQVDLSLTLSKGSFYQTIQKQLQYIGFYQRPTSAVIFFIIAFLLFIFYVYFLYLCKKEKLKLRELKILILPTFLILLFSYNAFSYDLFNYIFDAKILTFYHLNPYLHKPADFIDPMLHFMRWTHRLYPYGPSWLILTAPLSFIGLNHFLPTLFLFKTMIGLTFLGSCYLIYKISQILFPQDKLFNTVFFAFNPLVIIEGLVSSLNDFPLVFFGLLAIYLYLQKRKSFSFLSLIFSIGVKYATVTLIPFFVLLWYFERIKRAINWQNLFFLSILFSLFSIIFVSLRTTFQPWYLNLPFSLCTFVSRKYYVFIPVLISSIFCSLIYVVYVFMADYAKGYRDASRR